MTDLITHDRFEVESKNRSIACQANPKLVGGQSCGLVGRLEKLVRCVSLQNVGQLKDRAVDKLDV